MGAFNERLAKLGTDSVDLYLMHYPVAERQATWKVMEKLYAQGKVRAIGVSNFLVKHLEGFLPSCQKVKPMVNQLEFSPFLYQKSLQEYCEKNGIFLTAHCSLTRTKKFDHPALKKIAEKHGKTTPQILIRWPMQHGITVLPKSTNKDRILQNCDVFDFELDSEDMGVLDNLDEGFRVSTDPTSFD